VGKNDYILMLSSSANMLGIGIEPSLHDSKFLLCLRLACDRTAKAVISASASSPILPLARMFGKVNVDIERSVALHSNAAVRITGKFQRRTLH
jgi:hypothetical protein